MSDIKQPGGAEEYRKKLVEFFKHLDCSVDVTFHAPCAPREESPLEVCVREIEHNPDGSVVITADRGIAEALSRGRKVIIRSFERSESDNAD